jgi:restriction system protein
MKFQMAKNSLFAILLRSPWWASAGLGVLVGLLAMAVLPEAYRVAGALSGFPFLVISVLAAWRGAKLPSAARIQQTQQAVSAMAWPAFAGLLEQAFQRDGYAVVARQPRATPAVDFVLERQGRRMLVCARRWKSDRTGIETLRALQAAREAAGDDMPHDALLIGLGEPTDSARPFAAEHRIAVWQATELAQALRGLPLPTPGRGA